jgi:hypothetical protein
VDEGGEDFHDGGVVAGRVAGDALQCVDAAQADGEFGRSELLDGLGAAVGDTALHGKGEGASCRTRSVRPGRGSAGRERGRHA